MRLLIVKTTQTKLVYAAKEISEKADELIKEYEEQGLYRIDVGIGISTGECIVGNMDQNLDLTIQSSEMPSTGPLDSKDKHAIILKHECCYRQELLIG